MPKILAYKIPGYPMILEQTRVQRDWMDKTENGHAYKCFPVSLSNTLGFSIYSTDDFEFIWDGVSDSTPDHVKILKGEKFSDTGRGNGTISFYSGYFFKTDNDVSLVSIVPPNSFIDGATPFTSTISASFYNSPFPIAWKITRPNYKITIPAGTPLATLLPISLKNLSTFEIEVYKKEFSQEEIDYDKKRQEVWAEITKVGGFTNFYRDAVDYKGNKIGEHEVKAMRLSVKDFTQNERPQ